MRTEILARKQRTDDEGMKVVELDQTLNRNIQMGDISKGNVACLFPPDSDIIRRLNHTFSDFTLDRSTDPLMWGLAIINRESHSVQVIGIQRVAFHGYGFSSIPCGFDLSFKQTTSEDDWIVKLSGVSFYISGEKIFCASTHLNISAEQAVVPGSCK